MMLAAVLAVAVGYLPYRIYGPRGIGHALRLERELAELVGGNLTLQRDNEQLRQQIRRLRHDRQLIERVARDELGLIRPDEVVFRFGP